MKPQDREVSNMQTSTQTPQGRCKYVDLVLSKSHLHWNKYSNYSRESLFDPYLMGSTLSMAWCYVAHGDIWNEKTYFKPFPGKTKTESLNTCDNL